MKFSLREKIVGVFAAVCFVLLAVAATLPQPLYVGAFQGDGSQLTNMTGTGNFTIITNVNIASITNLNVDVISNFESITINTNVTVTQNFTVNGKGTINTFNYNTIGAITNVWSGPTNTIAFGPSDYAFSSATACQITGFTGLTTTNTGNVVLTLLNTSATNWNLTIPISVRTTTGVRGSITVTNGQERIIWIRYHPGTGNTNLVDCPNY